MRKATVFWIILAVICGIMLFHTSQEVTDGRTAVRKMERELLREEESLRVLQAEWSYLNQPERLEKLAREHLDLAPLNGKQFARVSDINERIDEEALAAAAAADTTAAIEPAAGVIAVTEKPAPAPEPVKAATKPADKAWQPPAPPAMPVAAKAPTPAPVIKPAANQPRGFDDVLKNLGVN